MGYPRNRAEEAIRINGYVDAALDWLMKHPQGWDKPHSLMDDGTGEEYAPEPHQLGQTLGGDWGVVLISQSGAGQSLGGGQSIGGSSGGGKKTEEKPADPPKRYMTQEEKEEQVKLLQQKIAQRKIEAAEKSVITEGEAEALRREQAKASQEVKEEWEKRQADIAIREAKKDRERTARALEIARENIERDKLERERLYNKSMGIVEEKKEPAQSVVEKKEYHECVLQIRLPPPLPRITGNFKATDTMRDVQDFVESNLKEKFQFHLMTPHPKVIYKGDNLTTTLSAAALCPRGAVVVEKI